MSATDHGRASTYQNYGCRCVACTSAKTSAAARSRSVRYAQRLVVNGRVHHPNAPHGTVGAYNNYGCRCINCTYAQASAIRVFRARKAAAA